MLEGRSRGFCRPAELIRVDVRYAYVHARALRNQKLSLQSACNVLVHCALCMKYHHRNTLE